MTPLSAGIWLLNVMIAISGTVFILAFMLLFVFYMNSSSRAELYEGASYHATTFRVTSVQYTRTFTTINESTSVNISASALGIVEGQREAMDLYPYLHQMPQDQQQLVGWVREGTVIPVYLFPSLRGQNRIQVIGPVPTAEAYQRQVEWASNRGLAAVGILGAVTALLSLGRFILNEK